MLDRLSRAVLMLAALFLLWYIRHVVLLVVGAVVLAVAIVTIIRLVSNMTGLSHRLSYLVVLLTIVVSVTLVAIFAGPMLFDQARGFFSELPELQDQAEQMLGRAGIVLPQVQELSFDEILTRVPSALSWIGSVFGLVSTAFVVFVLSWFFAFAPDTYVGSFSRLFPDPERAVSATKNSLDDLGAWIIGQIISMSFIGFVVGIGLWLLGVPYAGFFGLLAGLFEFVPFLGPLVGFIPAGIVALSISTSMFGWVLVFYIVVQFVQGNLVTPLIQRQAVRIQPAYQLIAILTGAAIFGPLGVLFAVPGFIIVRAIVREIRTPAFQSS